MRKEGRRVKDRVEASREVTEAHASKPYALRTVEKADGNRWWLWIKVTQSCCWYTKDSSWLASHAPHLLRL